MTNVRKMALVDPRLLETLRNPMQPPVDTTLRDLDADMTSILDRTDIEVSDKVRLYNQALLRYNDMTKTRANKPTRFVVVGEEKVVNGEDVEEENDCATGIIATMPKSLHMKARVLTARLKKTVDWNDRGELLHEGVAIPGSNITDLVHDLVRRRKTFDPIGWRQLASQLRSSNIPMELVGNVARRRLYVISTFATIVVVVVLLSSSADTNIWCVGGAVPWGGKNYNDTTTKNFSEVTVVSPRYESYQTRTSNAGYPNKTHTRSTNL